MEQTKFKVGDKVMSKWEGDDSYGRIGVVIEDRYQDSLCVDFGKDLNSGWYIDANDLVLLRESEENK